MREKKGKQERMKERRQERRKERKKERKKKNANRVTQGPQSQFSRTGHNHLIACFQ